MGMVGPIVDMEVLDELASQTVFGEHAFYHAEVEGMHAGFEVLVVRFLHKHLASKLELAAGIAGEVEIDVVGPLVTGKNHFVSVDDDHIVATLNER